MAIWEDHNMTSDNMTKDNTKTYDNIWKLTIWEYDDSMTMIIWQWSYDWEYEMQNYRWPATHSTQWAQLAAMVSLLDVQ